MSRRSNDEGFVLIVQRHQEPVRRLLRRLCGDRALADDLAQETFLRVYKSLDQFRGQAKISTWIYRIAFNVFLSKRRPPPATVDDDAAEPARDSEPFLEKLMQRLKPEERVCLTLFYAEEMTTAEIATVLDCPEGTVKTHIHRGKERLREWMSC